MISLQWIKPILAMVASLLMCLILSFSQIRPTPTMKVIEQSQSVQNTQTDEKSISQDS